MCRMMLLAAVLTSVLTLDAQAEHARYRGPLSRTAIALEAERGLFLTEAGADSSSDVPADSMQSTSESPSLATTADPSLYRQVPQSRGSDATVPIIMVTVMEAGLAGMTYATVRQHGGGNYFGGFMYSMGLVVPLVMSAERMGDEPFHTVSLLGYTAAAIYVGSRAISLEKHDPVDRKRMFRESFIGMNLSFAVPSVIEGTLRWLRGKR
jgi:hypothetical protein